MDITYCREVSHDMTAILSERFWYIVLYCCRCFCSSCLSCCCLCRNFLSCCCLCSSCLSCCLCRNSLCCYCLCRSCLLCYSSLLLVLSLMNSWRISAASWLVSASSNTGLSSRALCWSTHTHTLWLIELSINRAGHEAHLWLRVKAARLSSKIHSKSFLLFVKLWQKKLIFYSSVKTKEEEKLIKLSWLQASVLKSTFGRKFLFFSSQELERER